MNKFVKLIISLVLLIGLTNSEVLPANEKIANLVKDFAKNINKSDIIEAGKIIASLVEKFQEIKSEKTKPLLFLGMAAAEAKTGDEDACLQILENLEKDAKTMLTNIFSDIHKVKEALDDFMAQIKNIKNVCF